jgi:hypothetical protein
MSRRNTWPICAVLAGAALMLTGCQNSRNDSDNEDYTYDTVGEQHVYDQPKKRTVEPVRGETRVIRQQPAVATKSYDHVGEENVYDN